MVLMKVEIVIFVKGTMMTLLVSTGTGAESMGGRGIRGSGGQHQWICTSQIDKISKKFSIPGEQIFPNGALPERSSPRTRLFPNGVFPERGSSWNGALPKRGSAIFVVVTSVIQNFKLT